MQKVCFRLKFPLPLLASIYCAVLFLSCSRASEADPTAERGFDEAALDRVASKSLYFGHMSVGYDIVDGIVALAGNGLTILDVTDLGPDGLPLAPVFAHSAIGENTKPLTKFADFEARVENGMGANVDIAGMKLCYVDFDAETDVRALFESYSAMIDRLRREYPSVTFMHFTVPLTTVQKGPKALVKRLLGRMPTGAAENLARQEYNELIRSSYGNRVFDLAELESTYPDGSRETGVIGGRRYYGLVPSYTADGGHLNGAASLMAAKKFISFMDTIYQ